MVTKVTMPQLGESVVEGTVSRWLAKIGDTVQEYQALLEVSTDKVDTEVPSPANGTLLHIYVEEGQTVKAGVLLAVIGNANDVIPEGDAPIATHGQPHLEPALEVASVHHHKNGNLAGIRLSPVVARMVAEHHLDAAQIHGSGRDGRITKKDVLAFMEQHNIEIVAGESIQHAYEEELEPWERPGSGDLFKPTGEFKPQTKSNTHEITPSPMSSPRPVTQTARPETRVLPPEPIPTGVTGELVKLSNMRRAIADHMVRSKLQISPHVTTVFEVDMTAAMAHRETNKADFAKRGVNLTLTAYFVAAMTEACKTHPMLNSQWTEEGIYIHHTVNIGMATAIDDGLIVPVIKNTERLNLLGIAQQVNDLATRARNKQLKPDDIQGGTITLTNHGVSGSLFATPIINQPQAAIMGVGLIEKRVKVIQDAIAIRPCCYISLTFDHRIADGAVGDAWLMHVKQTLEQWI